MTMQSSPRIVVYGVGQYGGHIARLAVQRGWPVVAAFNRAGAKVGQDLGRVIGLDCDLDVQVQDCESADYEQLRGKADIGVVTQFNVLRRNMPAYQRLIGAGLNVGCHGTESYYPFGSDPDTAADIDQLALRNGVTFTGGGIWDMSRIWSGILIAGPCTRIDRLEHTSITDIEGQANSLAQAQQVGTGLSVQDYRNLGLENAPFLLCYKTIPEQVLTALGFTVRATDVGLEPIAWDVPTPTRLVPEGQFPAGTVVGTRVNAIVASREGPTASARIELRAFRPGETEHMFWEVHGLPRTRMRVERDDSAHATAASLFNRIPDIVAAPPGIQPVHRLGPLSSRSRTQETTS